MHWLEDQEIYLVRGGMMNGFFIEIKLSLSRISLQVHATDKPLVDVEDSDPSELTELEDEDIDMLLSEQEEDELELHLQKSFLILHMKKTPFSG